MKQGAGVTRSDLEPTPTRVAGLVTRGTASGAAEHSEPVCSAGADRFLRLGREDLRRSGA